MLITSVIFGKLGRSTGVKDDPYECGMLPVGEGRPRFSVKFYLVAMLFVIFDIEVVFMYPWAVQFKELIATNHHGPPQHGGLRGGSSPSPTSTSSRRAPSIGRREMIDHIVFYKLRTDVDETRLEEMVRSTRSILLKIPEVLSVHSGRNVDPDSEWPFFFSIEVESLDKLRMVEDDPLFLRFLRDVVEPNTLGEEAFDFEMDPSKDLRYS